MPGRAGSSTLRWLCALRRIERSCGLPGFPGQAPKAHTDDEAGRVSPCGNSPLNRLNQGIWANRYTEPLAMIYKPGMSAEKCWRRMWVSSHPGKAKERIIFEDGVEKVNRTTDNSRNIPWYQVIHQICL